MERRVFSPAQAKQYSPLTLAFLGDGVYELQVRSALVGAANMPVAKLHEDKIQYVCAAFQAAAVQALQETLTEEEQAVYRRGKNAGGTPTKNADPAAYRRATGLEAVFGYLYLTGQDERIAELFTVIWNCRDTLLPGKE